MKLEERQQEGMEGGGEGRENKYPLGITVAKSKEMEVREKRGLDGNDLRVELCRPGHGWCA